jgi:hypothetical protein
MINLKPVTEEIFSKVYERLIDAFPYEERRDEADEKKCFLKEQFNFCEITDNGESVGLIVFWVFSNFLFVEHIAINKEIRSKGYGSKTFELLKTQYQKLLKAKKTNDDKEFKQKAIRSLCAKGFQLSKVLKIAEGRN